MQAASSANSYSLAGMGSVDPEIYHLASAAERLLFLGGSFGGASVFKTRGQNINVSSETGFHRGSFDVVCLYSYAEATDFDMSLHSSSEDRFFT